MVWSTTQSALYKAVEQHNALADEECAPPHEDIPCERHREVCKCPCKPSPKPQGGFLSGLVNDRDSLLILAAIFILMHEKADKTLVLALAYILLA